MSNTKRTDRLRGTLDKVTKASEQMQTAFLSAEDTLHGLEDRESRRAGRVNVEEQRLKDTFPALSEGRG